MLITHFGFDEDGQFFNFTIVAKQGNLEISIDDIFICTIGLDKTGQWIQKSGNHLPPELIALIGERVDGSG